MLAARRETRLVHDIKSAYVSPKQFYLSGKDGPLRRPQYVLEPLYVPQEDAEGRS